MNSSRYLEQLTEMEKHQKEERVTHELYPLTKTCELRNVIGFNIIDKAEKETAAPYGESRGPLPLDTGLVRNGDCIVVYSPT